MQIMQTKFDRRKNDPRTVYRYDKADFNSNGLNG